MTRVQLIVLLYNLLLLEAQEENGATLKFSLGIERLSA
jgi:hypothetical protein